MKKSKLFSSLALLGMLSLGLASCGGGSNWTDTDFLDENASVSVATTGRKESFVEASYEERAEILGLLEEYALKNTISGLVLYDNGGYGKYSDRVVFPTNIDMTKGNTEGSNPTPGYIAGTPQYYYITGYGFGVQEEGSLDKGKPLSGLSASDPFATYYHTYETSDPKSLNYMDDKGSVVGDYQPYVASGYFSTKMNDTKDGYVWFPSTATEENKVDGEYRPLPLDKDGNVIKNATYQTLTSKYRIYVRTGADLKYATTSTNAKITPFNGREVAIEDYVTPIKELFTQSNGLARGAENLTGAAALKGMSDYYNASENGVNEEAWAKVGVKSNTDDKGSYLEFEFVTPCTPFYAMYYLSSSLYAPIPADFLKAIGGIKFWGTFTEDQSLTPVDTALSTGVYVVEKWEVDKEFVFKRNDALNPAVKGGDHRYKLDGLHVNILSAATTDLEAAWKEFKAGKLDAVGIPSTQVKAGEVQTAGTQQTKGSSSTKLNLNTCTQQEWEYFFGVNGTITQTPESNYWKVKPAMSNDDFLQGLSYSINRKEFAQNRGVTPSLAYFTDNYLSNPEHGVSYNDTEAHKKVMDAVYGEGWETNYGFDYAKAVDHFKKAATKWLADGTYKEGDVITIEICWQAEAQIKSSGEDIAKYIEDAFNAPEVCGNKLTLNIHNMAVAEWSDAYYKKMMVGQFDIALGGISGNTLNPLNFMEVLKSDNSSGFTLNWGPNTNGTASITYKGKNYTFDALFQAADTGAVVTNDGKLATTYDAVLVENTRDAKANDNSRNVRIKYAASNIANVVKVEVADVVVCWYDYIEEYVEQSVEYTIEGDEIVLKISKELAEAYQGAVGFDIYFTVTIDGEEPTTAVVSLNGEFPTFEKK